MQNLKLAEHRIAVLGLRLRAAVTGRLHVERGEGVISMAIAVLIIAFLGVALWLVFEQLVNDTGTKVGEQVENIGGTPG